MLSEFSCPETDGIDSTSLSYGETLEDNVRSVFSLSNIKAGSPIANEYESAACSLNSCCGSKESNYRVSADMIRADQRDINNNREEMVGFSLSGNRIDDDVMFRANHPVHMMSNYGGSGQGSPRGSGAIDSGMYDRQRAGGDCTWEW